VACIDRRLTWPIYSDPPTQFDDDIEEEEFDDDVEEEEFDDDIEEEEFDDDIEEEEVGSISLLLIRAACWVIDA